MTFNATPSALARVLRHHRIIWWTLAVSLILAWLGSLPARSAFGEVLDHSQAAGRFVNGFDLATFADLLNPAEIPQMALFSASVAQLLVFFVFLLFLVGGVYAAYASEAPLSNGAFFQACGAHFWRMGRLTLTSLIPFGLLGAGLALLKTFTERLAESPNERAEDYAFWAGLIVLGLLMLWVRAWFDLAQARTVAWGERGMFKTALRTFRLVPLRLFVGYVGIALVRLAVVGGCLWIWARMASGGALKPFLLLEGIVLVHIVTRLWQRAASVRALEAVARS